MRSEVVGFCSSTDLEEGVRDKVLRDLARIPGKNARGVLSVQQLAEEADACWAGAPEDENKGRHGRSNEVL